MKTILAMGQSNALGFGGPSLVNNGRVTVWNNENNVTVIGDVGSAFVTPNVAGNPFSAGNGNFLASAGSFISDMIDEDVRIVLVATGGQPIEKWAKFPTPGIMWLRMKAILAAAGVTKVDALLWHQGESDDALGTTANYEVAFQALLANLETDGYISRATPVIIGECSWKWPTINSVMHHIVRNDPRISLVRSGAFYTSDGTHFTEAMTSIVAAAYARELARLAGPWAGAWRGPTSGECAFVVSCGSAVTMPNGVDVKVPVRAVLGNASLIGSDGSFTPQWDGIWKFEAKPYLGIEKVSARILDDAGREVAFLCWSGNQDPTGNTMMMDGSAYIRLHRSQKVWFGLRHNKGSTISTNDQVMRQYTRFAATYIGED